MLIDNNLLNDISADAEASPRLRMNYDLRNSVEDGSQRMLNAVEVGTVIPIHRHRKTSETQIFMRGVVDVVFYDDSGKETERFHIDPAHGTYGVQVPAGQWHTLEVIKPAVLFEAKDGKYNPLSDKDFLEM